MTYPGESNTQAGLAALARLETRNAEARKGHHMTNAETNRRLADLEARRLAARESTRFGPPPTARHAADLVPTVADLEAPSDRAKLEAASAQHAAGVPSPEWSPERRAGFGLLAVLVILVAVFVLTALAAHAHLGGAVAEASASPAWVQESRQITAAPGWREAPSDAYVIRAYDLRHVGYRPSDFEAYDLTTGHMLRESYGPWSARRGHASVVWEQDNRDLISMSTHPVLVFTWRERTE